MLFFLLLACLLILSMLFIAVNSPNLAHQHWECKKTAKCLNNFNWDCSSRRGCLFILLKMGLKITFVSGFKWKNNWGNCNIKKSRTFVHYITKFDCTVWLWRFCHDYVLRRSCILHDQPCDVVKWVILWYWTRYVTFIEDEHTLHHIFSKGRLKGALISGTHATTVSS